MSFIQSNTEGYTFVYLTDPCSTELCDSEEYPVDTVREIEIAQERMLELGILEATIFVGSGADQHKTINKIFVNY